MSNQVARDAAAYAVSMHVDGTSEWEDAYAEALDNAQGRCTETEYASALLVLGWEYCPINGMKQTKGRS